MMQSVMLLVAFVALVTTDYMWSSWGEWSQCERNCSQPFGRMHATRHCLKHNNSSIQCKIVSASRCPPTENGVTDTQMSVCYIADYCHGFGKYTGKYTEWRNKICKRYTNMTKCAPGHQEFGTSSQTRECMPTKLNFWDKWWGREYACSDLSKHTNTRVVNCTISVTELKPIWSTWSPWTCTSECTLLPGSLARRNRTCLKCSEMHKNEYKQYSTYKNENCTVENGVGELETGSCTKCRKQWTEWSEWTSCGNVTCGAQGKNRVRQCSVGFGKECECFFDWNPVANQWYSICDIDWATCDNPHVQNACPKVHGNWSEWQTWQSCSVSCGYGTKRRIRLCNNPEPQFGGDQCTGYDTEDDYCSTNVNCAIDGNWNVWSSWICDTNCGQGLRTRTRLCDNPPSLFGGTNCSGSNIETENCFDVTGEDCLIETLSGPSLTLPESIRFLIHNHLQVTNNTRIVNSHDTNSITFSCRNNATKIIDKYFLPQNDKPEYSWMYDGVSLTSNEATETKSNITLQVPKLGSSGVLLCLVNVPNVTQTFIVELFSVVIRQQNPLIYYPGQRVKFQCHSETICSVFRETPVYQLWYRNEDLIANKSCDMRHWLEFESTSVDWLTIQLENVKKSRLDQFRCVMEEPKKKRRWQTSDIMIEVRERHLASYILNILLVVIVIVTLSIICIAICALISL